MFPLTSGLTLDSWSWSCRSLSRLGGRTKTTYGMKLDARTTFSVWVGENQNIHDLGIIGRNNNHKHDVYTMKRKEFINVKS